MASIVTLIMSSQSGGDPVGTISLYPLEYEKPDDPSYHVRKSFPPRPETVSEIKQLKMCTYTL